jgi:hypothetical protein
MVAFTATTNDGRPLFGVARSREYREFPNKNALPRPRAENGQHDQDGKAKLIDPKATDRLGLAGS